MPTMRPAERMTTHKRPGVARRRRRDFLHGGVGPWLRSAAYTRAGRHDESEYFSRPPMTFSHARARRSQGAPLQLDDGAARLPRDRGRPARSPRAGRQCGKGCSGRAARPCEAARATPTARRPPALPPAPWRNPGQHVAMVVAVQDELGAVPRQHRLQRGGILQAAEALGLARAAADGGSARGGRRRRRPRRSSTAPRRASCAAPRRPEATSGGVGTAELTPMSATGPSMRTNGNASPWPACAAPCAHRTPCRPPSAPLPGSRAQARIDVVVAGDDGHALRRSHALEPGQRIDVLLRQADVDEVAGDGDVVGRLRREVGDDAVEHVPSGRRSGGCAASWRSRAALQVPIARREAGDGPQMHVGQVGDGDRHWSCRRLSSGFAAACQIGRRRLKACARSRRLAGCRSIGGTSPS